MANPTWEERDLLVLRAAVEYCEEHSNYVRVEHLRSRVDLTERDIRRAFNALSAEDPKLFKGAWNGGAGVYRLDAPTGEARRRLGLWPTPESLADRLVQALALAADREPDEEQRSKLKSVASWLGSAGRDLAVEVAAAALNRQMGGE